MKKIGVIEGFFGPQWPQDSRLSYAKFLKSFGGDFYIYAPKEDPFLRKQWRKTWSAEYLTKLTQLANTFHTEGVSFGVGFSPFGLGEKLSTEDEDHLKEKLALMESVGIDTLGLFFDDMPVNKNLAQTQIQALKVIQENFKHKIIFCPSYYTPDPILDKVFGPRPENYLEDIASGISKDVALAWTGPKVISTEISYEHLVEVTELLKREPFIWENFFANDGPKNCKFLKLKPYTGRTVETFQVAEAFGFNLMNQPELSKILFLSAKYVSDGEENGLAFEHALRDLTSPVLKEFILLHSEIFLDKGLDNISEQEKKFLIGSLESIDEKIALEIKEWLEGKYIVDSDCLTD